MRKIQTVSKFKHSYWQRNPVHHDLVNKELTVSKWITQTLLEVGPGI